MREIKFRAWTLDEKIMQPVHSIDFESRTIEYYGISDHPISQTILMQYTGLKDCHGKDIYDGDICIKRQLSGGLLEPSPERTVQIVWTKIHNGWICDDGVYQYSIHSEQLEVIGNIYENSELLK